MHVAFYNSVRLTCRVIKALCIQEFVLHGERAERVGGGPMLLAVTHLGHLEPMIISCLLNRPVHWMSRVEFYRSRWRARVLEHGGAFPVDRGGFALPAVRRAIGLVREGRAVGVFPEGGRVMPEQSVVRGGTIKQGICTIAIRANVPVVPVVVLGCEKLSAVGPWLPARRGRLWIGFGRDVPPTAVRTTNRRDREEMTFRLRAEFVSCYEELCAAAGLRESDLR